MSKTPTSARICNWCLKNLRGSKYHSSIIFTMCNRYVPLHSKLRYMLVTCGYMEYNNVFLVGIRCSIVKRFQVWKLQLEDMLLVGMKIYFQFNCEVIPITSRMHLSDNYTRREFYDVYRSKMVVSSNKSVTSSQFTRLWRAWFRNVIILRKVRRKGRQLESILKKMMEQMASPRVGPKSKEYVGDMTRWRWDSCRQHHDPWGMIKDEQHPATRHHSRKRAQSGEIQQYST